MTDNRDVLEQPNEASSPTDAWEAANQSFLAIALTWLRLRLRRHAGDEQGILAPATQVEISRTAHAAATDLRPSSDPYLAAAMRATELRSPEPGAFMSADRGASVQPAQPADVSSDSAALEAATAELEAAINREPAPALVALARRLGLSRFEQDVLLLCIAMELDPGIAQACERSQREPNLPFPTFGLALDVFDDPTWEAASSSGALRYWRLVDVIHHDGGTLRQAHLQADERIVDYVKGLNAVDPRLEPIVLAIDGPPDADTVAPSQQRVVDEIDRRLRLAADEAPPVINLVGRDVETKRMLAAAAAAVVGRRSYVVPADALPSGPAELDAVARIWRRDSLLAPVALFVDAQDVDPSAPDGPAHLVNRFVSRAGGLVFLGSRDVWPTPSRPMVPLECQRPNRAEQQQAWLSALGPNQSDSAAALAGQFRLTVDRIRQILGDVRDGYGGSEPDVSAGERLWDACRRAVQPRMDALAQRLDAKATWDDLVLPDQEFRLLQQIGSQVRQRTTVYETWGFGARMNRGLGISALFAGPSGTGKSMAAEVIANALRLNLYRIDLSAVVSKYIGETEKNLRRVFDAAEEGGALLFFDEADALFGKRSEVKDSHDRYANIEINYLLQRMEEYSGVAVLATNMRAALDTAFVRRLRFIVTFSFPALAERRRIWDKVFPDAVPGREALDLDRLARLPATGGMIHNIALNAAFVAAGVGTPLTMPMVLGVARAEFRKQELPTIDRDFVWVEPPPDPQRVPPPRAPAAEVPG